jgi:hypothetical protein
MGTSKEKISGKKALSCDFLEKSLETERDVVRSRHKIDFALYLEM